MGQSPGHPGGETGIIRSRRAARPQPRNHKDNTLSLRDKLFVILQYLVPQHGLSRLVGMLARSEGVDQVIP